MIVSHRLIYKLVSELFPENEENKSGDDLNRSDEIKVRSVKNQIRTRVSIFLKILIQI
jgi:hypothetical protein